MYIDRICSLLRFVLFDSEIDTTLYSSLSKSDWDDIYVKAKENGVVAIVLDAISRLPKECQPHKQLKIQWAALSFAIETFYFKQLEAAKELAIFFRRNNVRPLVLKGVCIASYYPIPQHRECGDVDLFLGSDFSQGNELMKQLGAIVNDDSYKHTHIHYKNITFENHRYLLSIRGNRCLKQLEAYLRHIAFVNPPKYVNDTYLEYSSPTFNAIFLIAHSFSHFLDEGIKLRHILDWALLLKTEHNNINWDQFYYWCDKLHYTTFAKSLTSISIIYFGLNISNEKVLSDDKYNKKILNDIFESQGVYNKGYSLWKRRFVLLGRSIASLWKYHQIYKKSLSVIILKRVAGLIFERTI